MFKRTGGEDFPDHLKVLITGPAKSGKTTLLGTVPGIVIADTEPHANNLQSVAHLNLPYVTITGADDLKKLAVVLRDPTLRAQAAEDLGIPAIEAVAIDTLDTLQEIMKKERLRAEKRNEFRRDDWGWLKEEMGAIVRAFTSLPLHVFFTVHVKTQQIGSDEDGRTVVLPGLQGSIADEIAGMVGYSLYSFRKGEIDPTGRQVTRYWLQAEGDETFPFVGNRAAGRLPRVIEPSFPKLLEATRAGRPAPAPAVVSRDPQPEPQPAPEPAPEPQPEPRPAPEPQPAPQAPEPEKAQPAPEPKAPGDEPVNAQGLTFVKRVYDALGLPFPEELVRAKTMKQARDMVTTWATLQEEMAHGKVHDAEIEMVAYLETEGENLAARGLPGWLTSVPEPKVSAPVETIVFWVGHSPERAQTMYDREAARPAPRKTLLATLVERGATPQEEPQPEAAQPAPEPAPEPEPEKAQADAAQDLVAEQLGGKPVQVLNEGSVAPCEMCGNAIDDEDIATLSKARYKLWQCTACYIAKNRESK